tara:strand:- start:107 stop:427 length:321 start_codon:yes stop_codon:yes gene_type:complete
MAKYKHIDLKEDLNKEERKKILLTEIPKLESRITNGLCQYYEIKTVGDLLNFYIKNPNSKFRIVPGVGQVSENQLHGFIKTCFPEEYEERNKKLCPPDKYKIVYTY